MIAEFITRQDLQEFKKEIIKEIKNLFGQKESFDYLKSDQVKDLLGCGDSTLQKHRSSGRLPCSKIGGTFYYKKSALNDMLERNASFEN